MENQVSDKVLPFYIVRLVLFELWHTWVKGALVIDSFFCPTHNLKDDCLNVYLDLISLFWNKSRWISFITFKSPLIIHSKKIIHSVSEVILTVQITSLKSFDTLYLYTTLLGEKTDFWNHLSAIFRNVQIPQKSQIICWEKLSQAMLQRVTTYLSFIIHKFNCL